MKKLMWIVITIVLLAVAFRISVWPKLEILNGYSAKMACSCKYAFDRTEDSIASYDLGSFPISLASVKYNDDEKWTKASFLGMRPMYAVYKGETGCTMTGSEPIKLDSPTPITKNIQTFEWPTSENQPNQKNLESILDWAFLKDHITRSVVIIKDGKLVAERYGNGVDKDTPQLGWSMTKSITNALYGILVKDGLLDVNDTPNYGPWNADDRQHITYSNLMNMNSGLNWTEDYALVSDVTKMLYTVENPINYALSKDTEAEAGVKWEYSSGTTNTLSYFLKRNLNDQARYQNFAQKRLFDPLGITSAVLETDAQNQMILSSYGWMTARDWAKLGQLYLQDGIWNEKRILPAGWIEYSTTAANGSDGQYGAQIWLNKESKTLPDVDESIYYFSGYLGQRVFVYPPKNLVIVRLGLKDKDVFDMNHFAAGVIDLFE